MNYNNCDLNCPFNPNNAVHFTTARQKDKMSPLDLEDNQRNTLLVFEAPGYYEWEMQKPIVDGRSNEKQQKSTGSIMAQAFDNCGKSRTNYDICEAVRCFPGTKSNLIQSEIEKASILCKKHLYFDIDSRRYEKIICFGYIAHNRVIEIINQIQRKDIFYCPTILYTQHPSAKNLTQQQIDCFVKKNL